MDHDHNHGDMDMPMPGDGDTPSEMCSMNMLFTWDTTNLCIVFRQWHVRGTTSLLFSLVAVVLLGIGYEALRSISRRYEAYLATRVAAAPRANAAQASKRAHILKAGVYALQNFYAFMLMLVFMTYNGWVMVAVSLGAFIGYILFGENVSSTKDNACH